MVSLKRAFLGLSMILVALIAVACGSSTYTNTASSSSVVMIKTSPATVKGQSVTILTNSQGMTLYYFTPDSASNAACSGSCAGTWPPLVFTSSGSPASAATLPGTLSVVKDANGQQVEYNGHPLYTYSLDTAPGQMNGEGVLGKWFVATSTLSVQSAPQVTPTTGNGYGY